jgi:hypothetical protein
MGTRSRSLQLPQSTSKFPLVENKPCAAAPASQPTEKIGCPRAQFSEGIST